MILAVVVHDGLVPQSVFLANGPLLFIKIMDGLIPFRIFLYVPEVREIEIVRGTTSAVSRHGLGMHPAESVIRIGSSRNAKRVAQACHPAVGVIAVGPDLAFRIGITGQVVVGIIAVGY